MADPDLARHHYAYERLRALHYKGILPHAILLTGLDGVGKKATAVRLAMAFNCQRTRPGRPLPSKGVPLEDPLGAPETEKIPESCGACPACRQIIAGNHPDTITIEPSDGLIKIGQIRELLATLAMKPFGEGLRAVILTDAAAMNSSAANALLKILEEPPDRTMLILMAVQADSILPTIRSRCQRIRLVPLAGQYVQERLRSEIGLTGATACLVAGLAQGSYTRALEMAQPQWLKRRAGLLDRISCLSELTTAGKLIWADLLARDKAALTDFLDLAQSWLRDLLAVKSGAAEVMNQDLVDVIRHRANQFSGEALIRGLESISAVREAIRRTNPNLRLLVEAMVLNWNSKPYG